MIGISELTVLRLHERAMTTITRFTVICVPFSYRPGILRAFADKLKQGEKSVAQDSEKDVDPIQGTRVQRNKHSLANLVASIPLGIGCHSAVPRLHKIRQLQAAIAAGTYRVPAELIADKILRSALFDEAELQQSFCHLTDTLAN